MVKIRVEKNVNLRLMVIDEILPLCALPDNPLNSLFIHDNFLVNENNTKRDLWWNSHINERYEYHNPPIYRRLISWSLKPHNNQKLSSESRKLLGIILSWFCTSNNRELRDNASKALVCIYREAPDEILTLLNMFQEVNDLYVIERLYAAMYGGSVYCIDKTIAQKISDYVLENIFRKEEVLPHILIRDYALGIVKYALWCGIYEGVSEIPTMISVPFRSKFPKRFPSQNTIDKLEEKYKINKGFGYVVSSIDVGVGYGDFGRYIFKNALNRFEGIDDIEKMKRWMIKRTLQLGFNPEIHDSSVPGYFGRRGGLKKIELNTEMTYNNIGTYAYGSTLTSSYGKLNVPIVDNVKIGDGICWAAAVSSIAAYRTGEPALDADVLYYILDDEHWGTPTGNVTWVGYAFDYYGLDYTYVASGTNYDGVKSCIQDERPIYTSITNGTQSHAVVICGYQSTQGGYYFYEIMDPNRDATVLVQVSSTSTNFTFTSGIYTYTTWRRRFY